MYIRKIIKIPKVLILFLVKSRFFRILPDSVYLKIQYRLSTNDKLTLANPVTFNEKLQWLKLNDRKSWYPSIVDKFEVRKFVSKKIGSTYLVPLINKWNKFEDINFEKLPNQFVLKTTHDSGGVVVCKNKDQLDFKKAKKILNKSLETNYFHVEREWPYKNIKPQIICEKLLIDDNHDDLRDYKLLCFNGEAKIIQVISERSPKSFKVNYFNRAWEPLNIKRRRYEASKKHIPTPMNLNDMIKISEKLSEGIPFARIDLYEVNNKIYFGEITLYPASGFMDFLYKEDDIKLGKMLNIAQEN